LIDDLIKQSKIETGSRTNLARTGVGIAIRQGAAKPDISTAEAFKRALLNAKSIAYGDPALGALRRFISPISYSASASRRR